MSLHTDIVKVIETLSKNMPQYQIKLAIRDKWEHIQKTPFTVLISCILSLRTKDEVTEEASIRLLKKHHTPEQIIRLSEEYIQSLIYPVGFYKTKAHRIKQIAQTLIDEFHSNVPEDFNSLLSIKGIGRKTANIVMVYGFHKSEYLPIDTHCHRIPNRLGWIHTKTPDESEKKLKEIIPKQYWPSFNHLFISFGKTICTPISPHCNKCPISQHCKQIGVQNHR